MIFQLWCNTDKINDVKYLDLANIGPQKWIVNLFHYSLWWLYSFDYFKIFVDFLWSFSMDRVDMKDLLHAH